jgi:hypothetical protein
MADEPENHTLVLLREIRTDIAKVREEVREGFERTDEQIADVKAEVMKCRADVAGADLASKQVAIRLTLLEKRVKDLEESRPDACC